MRSKYTLASQPWCAAREKVEPGISQRALNIFFEIDHATSPSTDSVKRRRDPNLSSLRSWPPPRRQNAFAYAHPDNG